LAAADATAAPLGDDLVVTVLLLKTCRMSRRFHRAGTLVVTSMYVMSSRSDAPP